MGRPPIGKTAMTDAERQRRHRAQLRNTSPVTKPVTKPAQPDRRELAATLSLTAQQKLDVAIRVHKERLNKAFEQKVNEEVRKRIVEADDAMRKHNKELSHDNIQLEQMLNQRGVFSETQFNNLLKCIHPDNSASVAIRNELLPFVIKNKRRLVTSLH
jgi:hypothetical protein